MNNTDEDINCAYKPDAMILAEKLSDLVKCRTVSEAKYKDKAEFEKLHATLQRNYPVLFARAERISLNDGLLLIVKGKTSDKPIVLMSHLDVVHADVEGWKHPPFSGEIAGGSVWGRGSVDTKGSLSALLEAVNSLLAEGYRFRTDVIILSSSDEELLGVDAMQATELLRSRGYVPALVSDEGGGIIKPDLPLIGGTYAMIGMCERSGARVALSGSEKDIRRLERKAAKGKLFPHALNPVLKEMLNALSQGVNPLVAAFLRFAQRHEFTAKLVAALGGFDGQAFTGSAAVFKSPEPSEKALGAVKVARLSTDVFNSIEATADSFCAQAAKYKVDCKVISVRQTPPMEPLNSKGYTLAAEVAKEVFGCAAVSPFTIVGCTDARHFIGYADSVVRFAPIVLTPAQFASFHNRNENLSVSTLVPAVNFYRRLLCRFSEEYNG